MQKRLVSFYAFLLSCLPLSFKTPFADEMEKVFDRRLHEMGLRGRWSLFRYFISELLALPGLWFLACQHERRVFKMTASENLNIPERPASWGAALTAALPLLAYIVLVLTTGPIRQVMRAVGLTTLFDFLWVNVIRAAPMPMLFYLLLLGGLLLAWLKGFPHWSFTYLSWLVIFLISGMGIIPGLNSSYLREMGLIGFKDPYLQRIWIPFIITLLLALLLDHSIKPLRTLWQGWRRDWTVASFALFGILEFMVLTFFDEVPGPKSALIFWQLVAVALLAAGAVWYIRSRVKAGRILALLCSAALSIALSTGVTFYHWQSYPKPYGLAFDGSSNLSIGLIFLIVVIACLLLPALISAFLHRFIKPA